ncbi:MAG: hypothetical protein A2731_02380 [Candidatus Buchananbacteria bacterium RIFCSPHIGHO2_01_FULL_39_8]|uniref:Divalent-cation tolerance protein CutA n=1 Tax=Candidatus Buchananbacteria bacterium RIFCSPHIGHO2_01_FULL_39_8 TaxID=1797533 RepID=A0A1G1XZT6_9BACT|nr:MAG: hypothetical protein A2731_02380 [Candidatus Buchananbacteria bacterium RIFCSPHIGHO2_01_FULL_39_8]
MLVSISVTCKNKKEATKIASALLKKKLIACANIWPVGSIYWWQDKIQNTREVMLVCKSLKKNVSKIEKEIETLHSYEVPVIIVEVVNANKKCLDWIRAVIK